MSHACCNNWVYIYISDIGVAKFPWGFADILRENHHRKKMMKSCAAYGLETDLRGHWCDDKLAARRLPVSAIRDITQSHCKQRHKQPSVVSKVPAESHWYPCLVLCCSDLLTGARRRPAADDCLLSGKAVSAHSHGFTTVWTWCFIFSNNHKDLDLKKTAASCRCGAITKRQTLIMWWSHFQSFKWL